MLSRNIRLDDSNGLVVFEFESSLLESFSCLLNNNFHPSKDRLALIAGKYTLTLGEVRETEDEEGE